MIASVVDLDRCGEMRCGEGGLECVLGGGIALVVVAAIAQRTSAFILGMGKCGLSGLSVTRPPPWKVAAAPMRSRTVADATKTTWHPRHLSPIWHRTLLVQMALEIRAHYFFVLRTWRQSFQLVINVQSMSRHGLSLRHGDRCVEDDHRQHSEIATIE